MKSQFAVGIVLIGMIAFAVSRQTSKEGVISSGSAGDWIDVSAPLDMTTTPVYPGDTRLKFEFVRSFPAGDKVTLSSYLMTAHAGTHVDAPLHFVSKGASIDQVPLATLMGQARVIDCSPDAVAINVTELSKHDWRGAKRLLFRTRNSRNTWMVDPNFHPEFTYIAPEAAQLMADSGVELVGIDYLSAEKFGAAEPRTHQVLLGRSIPIVEGLDLRGIKAGEYDFIVLPLRVVGHEAAPARALLRPRQ
jgi:arylformamidase